MSDTHGIVSVIVPVAPGPSRNQLIDEALAVVARHYGNYELLVVAEALDVETRRFVAGLMPRYAGLRMVCLADGCDAHGMLLAGMECVVGDYTVILASDTAPVAEIPQMVALAARTAKAVLAAPADTSAGPVNRACRKLTQRALGKLLGLRHVQLSIGCCVLPRAILNAAARSRGSGEYLHMLTGTDGLPSTTFAYRSRQPNVLARRSWFNLADDVIALVVSNSKAPLRIVSALGIFASGLNLLYVLYVTLICLFKKDVAPGWTTLSLQTAAMFFFVFLNFLLLAEYLAHSMNRSRPSYHVLEELSNPGWLASGCQRRNLADEPQISPFEQAREDRTAA